MTNEEITILIQNGTRGGEVMHNIEQVVGWVNYIVPRIAAYFTTTMGIPFDNFKDEYNNKDSVEQLLFCLNHVKKKHYIL